MDRIGTSKNAPPSAIKEKKTPGGLATGPHPFRSMSPVKQYVT